MVKLTKAQVEVLQAAIRNGGEVSSYGVLTRTIEILRKEGLIRLEPRLNKLELENTLDVAYEILENAQLILGGPCETSKAYTEGARLLSEASSLFKQANAEVYRVTEKARDLCAAHTLGKSLGT